MPAGIVLSVIAPAHNEEGNIDALVEQVGAAAGKAAGVLAGDAPHVAGTGFEFILVDDGSTDQTRARAIALAERHPWLRIVAMQDTPPGRGNGQSAAFHAGFRGARGTWIATLDADLQNDPADYAAMARLLVAQSADMIQGDRSAARREGDAFIRRAGSIVGRSFRRVLLADTIRDTGCSLRIMHRDVALRLPLEFRGAHRFIPVTARQLGYTVVELPVSHRRRHAGTTKYGAGIMKRALPGLIDCFAIRWMRNRRRPVAALECEPEGRAPTAGTVQHNAHVPDPAPLEHAR